MKEFIRQFWWTTLFVVAIFVWWISTPIIQFLDPMAGTYTFGEFQSIVFAFCGLLVINGFGFLILKLRFPEIVKYLRSEEAKNDFEELSVQDKVWVRVVLYGILTFSFVWLVSSL